MILNGKPVWTYSPNWDEGILEKLEWKTDVLQSPTGAEQRRCLRLSPRRFFEASFYLVGRARQGFDLATIMAGGLNWYLPIWHDVHHLVDPLAAGAGTLPIPVTNREFRDGDYILLLGPDIKNPYDCEVVQMSTGNDTQITLATPTTKNWLQGTRVYPLRLGRLQDMPDVTKRTDNFVEAKTRFRVMETNDFPDTPTLGTYLGFPVVTVRPDESEDLTQTYIRNMLELDNLTGIPQYTDQSGRAFTHQQYRWGIAGRAANAELRRFLYAMRGRWKSFWIPTFMMDLQLTQNAALGATTLTVANVERSSYFSDPEFQNEARVHIRIEMTDGTLHYAKIIGGDALTAAEETIELEAGVGVALTPATVRTISYMALSRFDTDEVELQHDTDTLGVTRAVVTMRSSPALREATEWEPPAILEFSGEVNCLDSCEAPIAVRADYVRLPGIYVPAPLNEVWTVNTTYDFDGAPLGNLGSRYDASSLAFKGYITIPSDEYDPPETSPNEPFIWSSPAYPAYLYDSFGGFIWGHVRFSGSHAEYIVKWSALTGALISVHAPDGLGTTHFDMGLRPTNGDLWIETAVPAHAYRIDKDTLDPVEDYALSGLSLGTYLNFAEDGNAYYMAIASNVSRLRRIDPDTGDDDVLLEETQAVGVDNWGEAFVDFVIDRENETVWLKYQKIWDVSGTLITNDPATPQENEFYTKNLLWKEFGDALPGGWTGREIELPPNGAIFRTTLNYDTLNKVIWIARLQDDPVFDVLIEDLRTTKPQWAGYNIEPYVLGSGASGGQMRFAPSTWMPQGSGTYFTGIWGDPMVPQEGRLNSLYVILNTSRDWLDEAQSVEYGTNDIDYLARVPVCNRLQPGEYRPSIPYAKIADIVSYRKMVYSQVVLPVMPFDFMMFGINLRHVNLWVDPASGIHTTDTEEIGFAWYDSLSYRYRPQDPDILNRRMHLALGQDERAMGRVFAGQISSTSYKVRYEGWRDYDWDSPDYPYDVVGPTEPDFIWEVTFNSDGIFTVYATATTEETSDRVFDIEANNNYLEDGGETEDDTGLFGNGTAWAISDGRGVTDPGDADTPFPVYDGSQTGSFQWDQIKDATHIFTPRDADANGFTMTTL